MPSLTERVAPGMLKWLRRLAEVIQPEGPYMPYAAITKAGREKLAAIDAALKEGE